MGFFSSIISPITSFTGDLLGDVFGGITGADDVAAASRSQAAATLQTSREARKLNEERFGYAKDILSPYMGRADIASQQLMAELGLPQAQMPQEFDEEGNLIEPYNYAPGHEFIPSSAYMDAPGYQSQIDERIRAAEQSATTSGATTYGGRRLEAAGEAGGAVQSQYYTNYMNMLQNLSSPQVAQNVASLGVGQGATIGQQNIQAQNLASNYMMEGASARQAGMADVLGGGASIFSGALAGGYL